MEGTTETVVEEGQGEGIEQEATEPVIEEQVTDEAVESNEKTDTGDTETEDSSDSVELNYDDITVPDGLDETSQQIVENFLNVSKENKVPPEALKAQMEAGLKVQERIAETIAEKQKEALIERMQSYEEAARNDPEIGGEKFEENIGNAKLVLDTMFEGKDELKKYLLTETGLGSHPDFIKGLLKLAPLIKEDSKPLAGSESSGEPKTIEELLYPGL